MEGGKKRESWELGQILVLRSQLRTNSRGDGGKRKILAASRVRSKT
jgi:hypothetical protein